MMALVQVQVMFGFTLNGSSWNQLGGDINGEAANDNFGTFVSMNSDGNTVAVGARLNDGNGSDAGHVQYLIGMSKWVQLGSLMEKLHLIYQEYLFL